MYTETVIRKLKQNNVSKNREKTKQRMARLWKLASKEDRQTVADLADVALITLQRIYRTGTISAKLVVPLAQTFDIDPYYLIGVSDEEGECTEELLKKFLIDCGYHDIVLEHSMSSRKKRKKWKQELIDDEAIVEKSSTKNVPDEEEQWETQTKQPDEAQEELQIETEDDTSTHPQETISVEKECAPITTNATESNVSQQFADNMTEDEMVFLLRAVLLRAKTGGANAELANKLKMLLLGLD